MMFGFNGTGVEPELAKICEQHFQCENCPMKNGQVYEMNQVRVVCENYQIQRQNG